MLANKDAMATVAVKDIQAARAFYEGKLGLEKIATEGDHAVSYRTGRSTLFVYQSEFARTNKATSVTWIVGDEIDDIVASLKSKGISFEHYDFPGMTREGDVHRGGNLRVAWFKDVDGNIHSLASG
jgi:catechol 2,3-dioxygenase-like lactoylglutathione lyase family enzyme